MKYNLLKMLDDKGVDYRVNNTGIKAVVVLVGFPVCHTINLYNDHIDETVIELMTLIIEMVEDGADTADVNRLIYEVTLPYCLRKDVVNG